ncbi:integrase core domain-containing protein [Plantactinospora sp. ZYX-F-223]|uniref:integrase core domain-containing protein n=1 Tax=Plantactinospora sp. ZYX-F-223 TaxID=3144103 RepID=UPI0031FCC69A
MFDAILADAAISVVLSGVRIPRMNSMMERWIQACRHELLDRTLIWNQTHLLHALREYERHHNRHRPHRGIANARPLRPLPEPVTDPAALTHLNVQRHDRLDGLLHEYQNALDQRGRNFRHPQRPTPIFSSERAARQRRQ